MNPEAWIAVVALVVITSGLIIGSYMRVGIRIGELTKEVKVLGDQLEKDQGELLRMWAAIETLSPVRTQIEELTKKADELIRADRERVRGCAVHSTRLDNFDQRLSTIAEQSE